MGSLHILDHPLIQHKLTHIRDKNTGTKEFRELVHEMTMLMGIEITRDLPMKKVRVETPVTGCETNVLTDRKVGLIPILRAGLGMVDGMLELLPAARVGHVGLYRDPKTLEPVEYYMKLPPDVSERFLVVLDPMLATGGSADDTIDTLKKQGATSIKLMCLVASKVGVDRIRKNHPEVDIFVAAMDEKLNEHGYIVPGLGDAGDRLFGTE